MRLKGIYSGKSAFFQLFILLILISAGAILSSVLSTGLIFILYGSISHMMENPEALRLYQLFTATGTFFLPACITAWLCSNSPSAYLSLQLPSNPRVWGLTLISVFLLSPFITLTGLWNRHIRLPQSMEFIEKWIQEQELLAEQLTDVLLNDNGLLAFFFNMIIIAIIAAITEEFLFRGALQRILNKWLGNSHKVIWTVAFLFSAFHLQFYGFLPRLLLGAYFGYLLFWGKSIWLPVFAHFSNNAFAVFAMSSESLKENEYINGDIPANEMTTYILWAFGMLVLFCLCVKKLRSCLTEVTD